MFVVCVQKANPLTLPKRRLIKANQHYENSIAISKNDMMKVYIGDEDAFEINILGYV
jgi:hypothetical protein